jgi:hypothetical protein
MSPELSSAKASSGSLVMQVLALALGLAAIAWGAFCVYGAAFPGPCGDNMGPGLLVIEAWALDAPVGILLLLIAFLVRKGSAKLRKSCLIGSSVLFAIPFVASFFLQRWHCP